MRVCLTWADLNMLYSYSVKLGDIHYRAEDSGLISKGKLAEDYMIPRLAMACKASPTRIMRRLGYGHMKSLFLPRPINP